MEEKSLYENGMKVYDANQTNFKRPGIVGNAIRDNEVNRRQLYADVLIGKWGVVLTPVKGLTVSANLGATVDNTRANYLYSALGSSSSTDGSAYVMHQRLFTVNQQYLAEYKTDFGGSVHNFYVLAGNESLMNDYGIRYIKDNISGTVVYIAKKEKYLGSIVISDEMKEDAPSAIEKLKAHSQIVMLTGDNVRSAQAAAKELGINEFYSSLLPKDKVSKLEEIISDKKGSVIFVGDGINDAPVLTRADVGIAMGGLGSDAAIEAADIVIMDDKPSRVYDAVCIAKKTMRIVKQNIVFAIGVKVLFLILGAFGLMTMWGAVFADVGVTLLAVLNSLRALKI